MPILLQLYLTFARIGVMTFGGGMAMLPILQREIVRDRHWATDEEMLDYYAIGQCTPGIIAINTATFIGYKQKGVLGGVCATLGMVTPSLIIITIIATFLKNFAEVPLVRNAFAGIQVCVVVLILNATIKLVKKAVIDKRTTVIFVLVMLASLCLSLSPVVFVLIAAFAGIVLKALEVKAA